MRTIIRLCPVVLLAFAACGDNLKPAADAGPKVDAPPRDSCTPPTLQLNNVMSGDLTMGPTQREVFVDMSPPLDRSILWFSVRHNESSPRYGAVHCALIPANMTTGDPPRMRCRHESMGSDNVPPTDITIRWTVAVFDSGVTVQRGLVDTATTNPNTATLSPAVDPATAFVVLGGTWAGGGGWGNNDFTKAVLTNGTTLTIEQAGPGSEVPWQVVTMAGAQVQRGTSSLSLTETTKTAAVANIPPGSFALATYTSDNPSSMDAGILMLQATLTGTGVDFRRDLSGSAMQIAYEVVTLPFPARQFTTDFAVGETMKTQAVADLSAKSVAFSSSQGTLGQSGGRTAYSNVLELDRLGEAAFTFSVTAGMVTIQRQVATATASVSWNVLDLSTEACQ
jgi:hypothetical protein